MRLRYMEPQRSGKIVNIASVAGLGAASMHSPGSSASKAGVSLIKTTAYDVAGANIYVNAIACGGVMTPPFQAYLAGATQTQRDSLFQMLPLGRLGEPDEYASVAVFLASLARRTSLGPTAARCGRSDPPRQGLGCQSVTMRSWPPKL